MLSHVSLFCKEVSGFINDIAALTDLVKNLEETSFCHDALKQFKLAKPGFSSGLFSATAQKK